MGPKRRLTSPVLIEVDLSPSDLRELPVELPARSAGDRARSSSPVSHAGRRFLVPAGIEDSARMTVMPDELIPTLYEWAGGIEALHKLTRAFYEKVPNDPLIGPLFSKMTPDHTECVALFLGEVLGGPAEYSRAFEHDQSACRAKTYRGPIANVGWIFSSKRLTRLVKS